jgi:hypothetical protein
MVKRSISGNSVNKHCAKHCVALRCAFYHKPYLPTFLAMFADLATRCFTAGVREFK